ncbi:uncharacterized protein [Epargyreus clarus]|uniref:uncharacterized protein n=1 Tax=Epargyreus clarus TaxID=520877 RepID=UPI003C2C8491
MPQQHGKSRGRAAPTPPQRDSSRASGRPGTSRSETASTTSRASSSRIPSSAPGVPAPPVRGSAETLTGVQRAPPSTPRSPGPSRPTSPAPPRPAGPREPDSTRPGTSTPTPTPTQPTPSTPAARPSRPAFPPPRIIIAEQAGPAETTPGVERPPASASDWASEFSPETRRRREELVRMQLLREDEYCPEDITESLLDYVCAANINQTTQEGPRPELDAIHAFWDSLNADRARRRPRSPEEEPDVSHVKRVSHRDPRLRSRSGDPRVTRSDSDPGPRDSQEQTATPCASPTPASLSFAEATAGASRPPSAAKMTSPTPRTPDARSATAVATASTSAPPAAPPQPQPGINTSPTAAPSAGRFPPLIVEKLPNWHQHLKVLKEQLGRTPNARPFGQGVRFSPKDVGEYRLIQSYLTDLEARERISWYTYSLPKEQSLKVAIRGLPANTDPQDIVEELRDLGYSPEYARAIRARRGRPGCIHLAILKRTEDLLPGIYAVRELLCMPGIKIEAWRGKKGPAQCHRCQQFRHSSHNCHRHLACVRCGEQHAAHDCPRPLEEPATCANCGGPHPANHTACPVFRREARNKRAGMIALSTRPIERPRLNPSAGPVQPQPEVEQHQAGSLMAAANGPTDRRGAPKRSRRRRKKAKAAPLPAPPAPAPAAQKKPKKKVRIATTPAPTPREEQSRGSNRESCNTQLKLLQDLSQMLQQVITAISEGLDVGPAIRSGIIKMSAHCE